MADGRWKMEDGRWKMGGRGFDLMNLLSDLSTGHFIMEDGESGFSTYGVKVTSPSAIFHFTSYLFHSLPPSRMKFKIIFARIKAKQLTTNNDPFVPPKLTCESVAECLGTSVIVDSKNLFLD
jgi:hypothetical protein